MDELPDLDEQEARVLGSLIEKAMTTPDHYPMSLNGVRTACNQVSNRNPVVSYDETTVSQTLRRLADRGLAKMVHRPGDRVVKYKHAADEVLELGAQGVALLAVLLLRGPQTPGELRSRTSRYIDFSDLADVERTMSELQDRRLAIELTRQPGQKENRWRCLLTQPKDDDTTHPIAPGSQPLEAKEAGPATTSSNDERLAALEARVDTLEDRLGALLELLDVSDL